MLNNLVTRKAPKLPAVKKIFPFKSVNLYSKMLDSGVAETLMAGNFDTCLGKRMYITFSETSNKAHIRTGGTRRFVTTGGSHLSISKHFS